MVRGESTEELFRRLQAEMTELASHSLDVLRVTLEAFVSWEHNRMEVVALCCDLLQHVTKLATEQPLVRSVVCLLCRIAFRHPIPSIKTHTDIIDLETLGTLLTLIQGGDAEFIGDLMLAFASISWSEESEGRILWAILLDVPAPDLSLPSQAAIIAVLGTARWSLVERLDREKLVNFVGELPTNTIVQQIVGNPFTCVGWMRLLLFSTFRSPLKTDTRPLWNIILAALPNVPHLFSRGLPGLLPNLNNNQGPEIGRKGEQALWMMLFWSSRFFEMECRSWSDFKDATVRLKEGRQVLLRQLEELCFGLEGESQGDPNPATARTKAYMEMTKLLGGAPSTRPPHDPDSQEVPGRRRSAAADPPMVAPKDTPPVNPTGRRQNSILSQIQDNLPPSPTTSSEPLPSHSQPPSPSQERSESPVPMNNDGNLPPPPVQSDSGTSEPTDAGAQPTQPPAPPDRGDEAENSSMARRLSGW